MSRSSRRESGGELPCIAGPPELLESRLLLAAFTWDGGGGNNNWQTPANWVGDTAPAGDGTDDLIFPAGAARKSNNNNFATSTAFASITIQEGGYTLSGNALVFGTAGLNDTSPSGANAVSFNMAIAGATTISDDAGGSADALTVSGVISGTGSVTKDGNGSVIFTAANTYSGGTTLAGGNTFPNNASGSAFGSGAVTNTSGTLRGNGSFTGALTHNAGLAPGASNPAGGSAGTLTMGGIDFGATASYGVNIFSAIAGSGYDQIVVNGAVTLDSGHALNASGTFTPSGGERLFIIVNDGSDAVIGAFAGLEDPSSDTVEINGADYRISYTGDSASNAITGGNDVVLYVEAPNAAPVNTVPGAQTTDEDTPKVFSAATSNAITIADADAGSANIQVALSVNSSATITLPSATLVTGGANGSAAVTLTGSVSAVNAALNGMNVTPEANSSATITLQVATNDLGNSGTGGAQTDTDTVSIAVTAVNDPPVNSLPPAQTTPQNVSRVFSSANANAITVSDIDAGASDIEVALTASNGTIALGTTSGITITAGANGSAGVTFTGNISQVNAALNGLSFTPTSEFLGAASIQIATSDLGATGAGGAQTDTDTVNITVASPGVIAFSDTDYSVAEDAGAGFAVITVQRTGGSAGEATVDFATSSGTATAGTDYTNISGTLTFADGETSKTFNVPITDDALDEDDETVNLLLSGVSGATLGAQMATLTIVDNDPTPSLSIGNAVAAEGNSGTSTLNFTVTLSGASARTVTVDFATADGTATAGSDYTAASGTLTFAPGETTKTIAVSINGDATIENNETFTVTLSNASNATVGSPATGTIADDDAAGPTLTFAQDVIVNEGNTGTANASFTVNLIVGGSDPVTVDYATQAGTAAQGADYTATSGTLTFLSGETTKTIMVPVIGDMLNEENESFTLVLSNPGGAQILTGTSVATILDDDPPPMISIADAMGLEGTGAAGSLEFTVSLSAPSGRDVTVGFTTGDGTAEAGADYTPISGMLTFAPGETSKAITVATVGDTRDEFDETFTVTFSDLVSATVGNGQAIGTITDDDEPPSISVNDVTIAEPPSGDTASGNFTVSLSEASGKVITVDFATIGGTATEGVDYQATSGTLTFVPGETSKTIPVSVLFDGVEEPVETFTMSLANATNATIDGGMGAGRINNTNPNAAPVAANDVAMLAAGQASLVIDVLANDTDAEGDPLTVSIATDPAIGTAIVNADQTITYTPSFPGVAASDSFTYTVTDGIGGSAAATVSLTITGNAVIVNPTDPTKQDLFIAASSASDQIELIRVRRQVQVLINGQDQGTFSANGRIVISAGAGDDTLLTGRVRNPVLFNGGEGNDTIVGGPKGDILVGGPGADTIRGGGGRDLIIGGDGADTLTGLGGSDILIAGTTIYDADTLANRAALNDLLTELTRRGRYSTKLANFTSSAGVGASGAKLIAELTMFDDNDMDTLSGGGSADFYAAQTDSGVIDVFVKRARNENVIEL